ncbi:hypothetical protein L1987_74153 [Smallanthus sonchifolius]|uniref:Uncharacterized protein n=1 Tax=Smallanthus sonchifolius TaxID=185202 RepID=A0ACB9A1X0_9ASTR|nr:hypothetical protein L1987_74153 [Smallanthus sonchifolius]
MVILALQLHYIVNAKYTMNNNSILKDHVYDKITIVKSPSKEKGPPLPKFGDWDVNDPASAEGFTVIFNKARNEKKTGGTSDSPPKSDPTYNKPGTATLGKPQSKKWFCCMA